MKLRLAFILVVCLTSFRPLFAEEGLQHLSGTLTLPVGRPSPGFLLKLDGSPDFLMRLEGEALEKFHAGDHVFASGIIKTSAPPRPVKSKDGVLPQIFPAWDIFMVVREARVTLTRFGWSETEEKPPEPTR